MLLVPLLFSVYFFADVVVRASEKYFWLDELSTLYVCRYPLTSFMSALRHGIDFNPPLFYLITKVSKALLGETLIGMRAPEMIGFWVLCLCLYRVVSRRAGVLAGTIAMLFPLITGAFYYAYEARPYGLVLGFCGLALVCWQMTLDRPGSRFWLVCFSLSLLCASLVHCYGVLLVGPFALFELLQFVRSRRVNWPAWTALIAPEAIAAASYVPLFRAYTSVMRGIPFPTAVSAFNVGAPAYFYELLLLPCILVVLAWAAIFTADRITAPRARYGEDHKTSSDVRPEVIVSFGFIALPLVGMAVATLMDAPFISRYFLSALVGVSLLIGFAASSRRVAQTLLILIVFPIAWHSFVLVVHRYSGTPERMIEPSSGFEMNSAIGDPLSSYQLLTAQAGDDRPIAVLDPMDFTYLLYYAPQFRSRLYYLKRSDRDFFARGFENFHPWAPFKFNREMSKDEFRSFARRSLIYGRKGFEEELGQLVRDGSVVKSLKISRDHFLAALELTR